MPKGPKGEKRPADVVGAAVKVMKIATGELEEDINDGKNVHAVVLGRLGGAKGGRPEPKVCLLKNVRNRNEKLPEADGKNTALLNIFQLHQILILLLGRLARQTC